MKILVLEDNERLSKLIKNALNKHGYIVDLISDGEEALDKILDGYSCFVLDINVPSLDGISVLESIKMYHKNVPTIIISSNHDLEKIQKSYETGCDDYIKKPFFMYELIHKIQKLCFKEVSKISLGEKYIYDIPKRLLTNDNDKIELARKEILLLELLTKDINRVFSFDEIEEYVWEGEPSTIMNIRALVKRIRKKIPEKAIKIVKGIGYSVNATKIDE